MLWRKKKQISKPNDEVYEFFDILLFGMQLKENNEGMHTIWKHCFRLNRWIFLADPDDNGQLFYGRHPAYDDKLCVFAFTDTQHLEEFEQQYFGNSKDSVYIANSPQNWVQSLSESNVEIIIFNEGTKGRSWYAPVENLRYIQEMFGINK